MQARIRAGCVAAILAAIGARTGEEERRWDLELAGFFGGGTKPLYLYGRERDGRWIGVVGSSRDPARQGGKTYNRSWYYGDLSAAPIQGMTMKGRVTVHFTPDNWVPLDHRSYTVDIDIDAKLDGADRLTGTYVTAAVNTKDPTAQNFGRKGQITGTAKPFTQPALPDPVTVEINLQGALVGGDPKFGDRCLTLILGFEGGRLASTIHATTSQKFEIVAKTPFRSPEATASVDRDRIAAHIVVPTKTLDMEPCRYVLDIDGRLMEGFVVGVYDLTAKIEGARDVAVKGSFDGKWYEGIARMEADDRPWYAPVRGFRAPAPGEHPRLLFRNSDVPALRRKAETTEGRAILARIRQLLDGANGDTMTTRFSPADQAYDPDLGRQKSWDTPGVYTMSHVAGYGLLYQLTGDRKYAEFGRQAFEKALDGARDRDDRYSFRKPGGALRAGPAVGWYAVGYDLCYDGWDDASREKFGRAIAEYREGDEGKTFDLEALARGTMPPGSNHFGMQIGGASLALLAVTGERWVDQKKVDTLLEIAAVSIARNVVEGFGDGGFFSEGDGTGSMSSQIAYLSAVQAWKNAAGRDYVNVERPNVRMLALKWVYQTVIRDGRPDFWPIRGAYGQNVWSREGLSGGGYYGIGMGAVTEDQRAAMKWCYDRFLLDADARAGGPCDTVTRYPHIAACAFVNWPVDLKERDPAEVLPLCYTDTSCGFYLWRNRWRDGNDTVITVLSNRTQGYMGAKPDRSLSVNSMGRHGTWGTIPEGATKHWWTSPMGEASSLTLSDGTCIAVDFTGASGADVMLVTTGEAEGQSVKVGGRTLTFHFPTAPSPPGPQAEGRAAVVGKQRVSLEGGNLVLAVTTR